jgi:citrate synthase
VDHVRAIALCRPNGRAESHPPVTIEHITTKKNGALILNIDGIIAALFIDILIEREKYSADKIQSLIDAEFFNALFVISRSVGFIAHFMEQKKHDEGLFRLPDDLLHTRKADTT